MEKKFVTLMDRTDGENGEAVIDSLPAAISSLEKLGIHKYWASITNAGEITMLNYSGWICKNAPERTLSLPLPENYTFFWQELKILLEKIFFPFAIEDESCRSLVGITRYEKKEDYAFVALCLIFQEENNKMPRKHNAIKKVLTSETGKPKPVETLLFLPKPD
jgi:hypothetical protein